MKQSLILFIILMTSSVGLCQDQRSEFYNVEANPYNVDEQGLAVQGYDVVEYFRSGIPTKGLEKYQIKDEGITYRFANSSNLETFRKQQGKYKPQYGGYCAFGVGIVQGEAVGDNKPGKYPANPLSFKIIDEKLYLFYLDESYDALEQWEKNEPKYLQTADKHWSLMNDQ